MERRTVNKWTKIGLGTLAVAGAIAYGAYRRAMSEANDAYARTLRQPAADPTQRFVAEMVAGLPEIAQRYFRHAIAPGTPLYSAVELEMEGTFLLGDKNASQAYAMTARQALR